jgi:uncharacterized protein (TIGR02246 family)
MAEEKKKLEKILQEYEKTVNSNDFEGWLSLWADEGIQLPPNAPANRGIDQIKNAMKPAFDELNMHADISEVTNVHVFGDVGVTTCLYSINATPKAGGESFDVMKDGKALTIFKKSENGEWKVMFDCFNSNITP